MAGNEGTGAGRERHLRVLVVDDNRDAADSLSLLLQVWGYQAEVAYDGVAGLEAALESRPDCLILDITMPRMDGYALAREVRQSPDLREAKLIALTAMSSESHARRMREAGFDHHLVKPASPDELEALLEMMNQMIHLAEKTEELARRNVELASQTQEILSEVKQDLREVKQELREVREELREAKERTELDGDPAGATDE